MADINDIMNQARAMQEQFKKAQEEAMNMVVDGESGAGLVKVQMTGRHDVKRVELAESLLKEDRAVIEDLIAAAFNDAARKVEEKNKAALSGMGAGFKLPDGFKFPF